MTDKSDVPCSCMWRVVEGGRAHAIGCPRYAGDEGKPDEQRGIYIKWRVTRLNDPTGKHQACSIFVLDETHDKFAGAALRAYAAACEAEFPKLAEQLRARHPISPEEPTNG